MSRPDFNINRSNLEVAPNIPSRTIPGQQSPEVKAEIWDKAGQGAVRKTERAKPDINPPVMVMAGIVVIGVILFLITE